MDYRKYLASFLGNLKAIDINNSCRKLNSLCGFTSPNALQLVATGQRHFSPSSAIRVSEALPFTVTQRKEFLTLFSEYYNSTAEMLAFQELTKKVA